MYEQMRKVLAYALCWVLCLGMLSGCGPLRKAEGTLTGEIFESSHGSEEDSEDNSEENSNAEIDMDIDTEIEAEEEAEYTEIASEDTYWVANTWNIIDAESGEEVVLMDPDAWELDLLIRADGTAQFRDVHDGVCLINDSCLNMTWERTEEGRFRFYNAITSGSILESEFDSGLLRVYYEGLIFEMEQRPVPHTAGEMQIPAELAGTWLSVSSEVEGYAWEVMPGELSSMVIRVTSIDGPLVLVADMESRDYYGDLYDSAYTQEISVLDGPLYEGCGNEEWSVQIGAASAVDENGYPMETEYYATMLDYNTILLQQYFTIDGTPAVSYQTYMRFPDIVSWQTYEAMELGSSNWVCYDYVDLNGEPVPMPEEAEGLSIYLSDDQTCQIQYGDGSTAEGLWQLEHGGVILLRSEEESETEFWIGGAVSGYYIDESIEAYDMNLYYNGGIMKLVMNRHG